MKKVTTEEHSCDKCGFPLVEVEAHWDGDNHYTAKGICPHCLSRNEYDVTVFVWKGSYELRNML